MAAATDPDRTDGAYVRDGTMLMGVTVETYAPDIGPMPEPTALGVRAADWTRGVLLRAPNHLGDCVMALPAAWQLRRLLPEGARLVVACRTRVAQVWQSAPWVDGVIGFPQTRLDAAAQAAVAAADLDAALLLPNSFGSALDLRRAGVPCVVGRRGRGRALLLHHSLPAWTRRAGADRFHETRHYLELVAALGPITWTTQYPPLVAALDAAQRAALDARLAALGDGPRLVIAPGAAYGPAKQWPAARFAAAAAWWAAARGPVVAIGAPGEEAVAAAALTEVPRSLSLAGQTSLTELIHVLATATAVLANDSGSMHLSGAVDTPCIAVFGSTDPVATGPVRGRAVILRQPLPCSPCLARTCPRRDLPYECLQAVDVPTVIRALNSLETA